MGFCLLDKSVINEYPKILEWKILNIKGKNEIETCKSLINELNNINFIESPDNKILIEQQPNKNPKMRVCEGYLISYMCTAYPKMNIIKYSPKYKLKLYTGNLPDFNILSEYMIRKKTSIIHTNRLISFTKQEQKFIDILKTSKKKDDLSDSFLQGFVYTNRYFDQDISGNDDDTLIKTRKKSTIMDNITNGIITPVEETFETTYDFDSVKF